VEIANGDTAAAETSDPAFLRNNRRVN